MPYQTKTVLRHRRGDVHVGFASEYPKQRGWQDVIGVPVSMRYGIQLRYNPALAERDALLAIKDKVSLDNTEDARKQNLDLYWKALEKEYDDYNVHQQHRKQRPLEVTAEPKSTAEAICRSAGVPEGMADKIEVYTIS